MISFFSRISESAKEKLAYLVSLALGSAYLFQSWYYAHHQISVLDEGAYLVKGFLYATGRYSPFQDYGPLTNHMPLAFLIPGWVQMLFGPGLRTGRYFAVFLGLVMLIGLWLLIHRLRGAWWAAAAIGIVAVNPALVKMYSVGVSQVLVSCMLVWTLYFSLGAKRNEAHLITASILAAAIWFTRINMAPVLLLLLAYIYWEYGIRVFTKCAIAGFGFLLLGHILYWPGVLKIWAYWLPEQLTPFLNTWRLPPDSLARWSPTIDFTGRLNSFLQAIRFNLVPVTGLVAGTIMWNKSYGKNRKTEKSAMILLGVLFSFLFLLHAGASLVGNYCVYCFQVYLGFFDVLSIVFVILAFSYWVTTSSKLMNAATVLLTLAAGASVGFAAADALPPAEWLRPRFVRELLGIKIFGSPEISAFVQNKFGLDFQRAVDLTRHVLLIWIPILIGLLLSFLVLLLAWRSSNRDEKKGKRRFGFAAWSWTLLIGVAVLLSPTSILGAGYTSYDCSGDVIASYEGAGRVLAENVQPGGLVYWSGGDSAVPLLYIPYVEIFPAQLNDGYTFRIGGDSELIHRLSYWDEPLRTQWLEEADYLLIEGRFYDDFWVNTGNWVHVAQTPPVGNCRDGAEIHILARVTQ
jgi:hypothetical protein